MGNQNPKRNCCGQRHSIEAWHETKTHPVRDAFKYINIEPNRIKINRKLFITVSEFAFKKLKRST